MLAIFARGTAIGKSVVLFFQEIANEDQEDSLEEILTIVLLITFKRYLKRDK